MEKIGYTQEEVLDGIYSFPILLPIQKWGQIPTKDYLNMLMYKKVKIERLHSEAHINSIASSLR